MSVQGNLFARYLTDLPVGTLEWIGVRPERKQPMLSLSSVEAFEGRGLEGDHRCSKTPGSARQATIISHEYIAVIARLLKMESIDPALLRRNMVVSGINLTALRYQCFQIGGAVFEASALCHPCSRMEKVLGKGGVAAMLGHGGLCAKIIVSGKVTVGDSVTHLGPAA